MPPTLVALRPLVLAAGARRPRGPVRAGRRKLGLRARMRLMRAIWITVLCLAGLSSHPAHTQPPPNASPSSAGNVNARRVADAEREPDQWLVNGRDAGGTFFSPL